MNKFLLLICSCSLMIFNSCKQDENNLSTIGGYIDIKLSADSNVLESESRSVRSYTPDIGDFGLKVSKWSGEIFAQWDKFSDFRTTGVPAGKYKVEAYYGDGEEEGFDALSYYGSSQVSTGSDEIVETSVVCTINKALVSISYTDSFKDYFKSYKGYISTSKGNKVVYEDGEERSAYFVPGELDVFLEVTRDGVADTVRLNPTTFKAAARTEYRLTMDVDAGTSTLNIIFNDRPSDYKNVTINISDAVLNAAPPKFTLYGFESGKDLEVLEHSDIAETLQAYLNAPAGISKCKLISNSAYLKSLGDNWKDTLDLANLSDEEKGMISSMELETIGLGDRKDQIAVVNFNKFVSKLGCMTDANEVHRFILAATDKLSKVSDTIYFNVVTRSNQFAFAGPAEPVPYGSTSVEFDLTLEGVHDNVVFKENSGNGFVEIDEPRISIVPNVEDNLKSKVTITFDNPLYDTEKDHVIRAEYGGKVLDAKFEVDTPVLTLSLRNGDADVWATKAYFAVEAKAKVRSSRTISTETIKIQYKDGEDWVDFPNQTYNSETNTFEVTGIGENATAFEGQPYTVRAVYVSKGLIDEESVSNEITIITEPKLQIPNAGFEEWSPKMVWYRRVTDFILRGGLEIYSFYPYMSNEDDKWWTTNNSITTNDPGCTSWYYVAYPAVVPTNATETHTALWHIKNYGNVSDFGVTSITNDVSKEGNTSMEISTIGHGDNRWSGLGTDTEFRTAGKLFIGNYSESGVENLGHSFNSRPQALKFSYKFYPYNRESTKAYIILYDDTKEQIGYGEINISEASDEYIDTENILITYSNPEKLASYITIVFMSSNSTSPITIGIHGSKNDWDGNGDSRHIGSVFVVDNVELVY